MAVRPRRGTSSRIGQNTPSLMMLTCIASIWILGGSESIPAGFFVSTIADTSVSGESSVKVAVCPLGNYCVNGVRKPCPGGTFGATTGLSNANCSGICLEGWFCPDGSDVARAYPCGNAPTKFCPAGSSRPHKTGYGYYAVSDHRSVGGGFGGEELCPVGSYCINGTRMNCPAGYYGSKRQEVNATCSGMCPAGFFCPGGTSAYANNKCTF
jgi:hypothetical protein